MKPVHVGLLVLGAALAGWLAMKMTPPPLPVASAAPAKPPAVVVPPTPAAIPRPPVTTPETVTQPEIYTKKPSPLPPPVAPQTVYTAPARHPEPARPAIVRPPVVVPRRREEIAQARPLDVPPLPAEQPAAPPSAPVAPAAPPAPAPALHQVTLRPGVTIMVRLDDALSTERNTAGNTFNATLVEPIVVDGLVIAERGARATGRVLDSQKAGRTSGVSMMTLALSSVTTSDGQHVSIATDPWIKRGERTALGAVMATRGTVLELTRETIVAFRVSYAVTITERRAI